MRPGPTDGHYWEGARKGEGRGSGVELSDAATVDSTPSPREERAGRGLGRGEIRAKTPLLSPPLSSRRGRRGRSLRFVRLQISHSEKFDKPHAQKGLALVSQLTLYNAPGRVAARREP